MQLKSIVLIAASVSVAFTLGVSIETRARHNFRDTAIPIAQLEGEHAGNLGTRAVDMSVNFNSHHLVPAEITVDNPLSAVAPE
ncbi:hypothetical protein BDN71DRAFT_161199 [Pleurotus eryngii]|uniref:Uncharacterized protein n=1 Tax=Pleurotus eryngii TaxID=5323 RepID=A0A9P5ZQT5_PLEER|nr:hypothetical protein BDN71DRAFT_161199 [Pleurotus eryngii]